MRHLVGVVLLLGLWLCLSCGTLVETLEGGDGGSVQDGGLVCAAEDPCTCAPCTSSAQCLAGLGLSCVPARRHSTNCPDSRFVCSATK